MKPLLLPGIPPHHTSFGKHRFNSDLSRFSLNLSSLSLQNSPSPRPALGSPYLSPPMSGSSPPIDALSSPETRSRRRARSDSASRGIPPTLGPQVTQALQWEEQTEHLQVTSQEQMAISTSAPFGYGLETAGGILGTTVGGTGLTTPMVTSQEQLPGIGRANTVTGATRRTKAHVPSACVNCKKKHLRCDNGRPCRRCVQSGKEVRL
jgi:hypothetical protein